MADEQYMQVARFEDAGEVREVHLLLREGGGAHVMQLSWGPLTRAVYGEKAICQRLSLDERGVMLLSAHFGWVNGFERGIRGFFSIEDASLADLLDDCSYAGIACRFCTIGSDSGSLSGGRAVLSERRAGARGFSLVP